MGISSSCAECIPVVGLISLTKILCFGNVFFNFRSYGQVFTWHSSWHMFMMVTCLCTKMVRANLILCRNIDLICVVGTSVGEL